MGKLNELETSNITQVINTLPTPKPILTVDGLETLISAISEDMSDMNEKISELLGIANELSDI